jgi:hypothetical protein
MHKAHIGTRHLVLRSAWETSLTPGDPARLAFHREASRFVTTGYLSLSQHPEPRLDWVFRLLRETAPPPIPKRQAFLCFFTPLRQGDIDAFLNFFGKRPGPPKAAVFQQPLPRSHPGHPQGFSFRKGEIGGRGLTGKTAFFSQSRPILAHFTSIFELIVPQRSIASLDLFRNKRLHEKSASSHAYSLCMPHSKQRWRLGVVEVSLEIFRIAGCLCFSLDNRQALPQKQKRIQSANLMINGAPPQQALEPETHVKRPAPNAYRRLRLHFPSLSRPAAHDAPRRHAGECGLWLLHDAEQASGRIEDSAHRRHFRRGPQDVSQRNLP